jgi:hypothetical protein
MSIDLKTFWTSCLVAAVLTASVAIFGIAFPIIVVIVYGISVWRKK